MSSDGAQNIINRTKESFQNPATLLNPFENMSRAISNTKDLFGISDGNGSGDGIAAGFKNKEDRSNAVAEQVKNDLSIDPQTREEIFAKISQAAPASEIEAILAASKAGEGIYGNRNKNFELVRLLQDKPGQKQLFLSNQQRAGAGQSLFNPLPASSGPLLTGGRA